MRPLTQGATEKRVAFGEGRTRLLERRPTLPTVTHTLLLVFDGGGAALTTGVKGDVQLHEDFTIRSWTLLADQTGSIVVDIWMDTYANYPPTDADSITGGNKPEIASGIKATDATLTGWTTDYVAGDTLRFNIDSVTTITRCTLALELEPGTI